MSSTSESFHYSPLDRSQDDAFRLLSLDPGGFNEPIRCTLMHDSRTSINGSYEALSYCWGDYKLTKTILVDGCLFKVTENLESALRCLRDDSVTAGRVRTLWVDAICINQADVPERNHQVSQMQRIYADAEEVLVWLGPASSDSGIAIPSSRKFVSTLIT